MPTKSRNYMAIVLVFTLSIICACGRDSGSGVSAYVTEINGEMVEFAYGDVQLGTLDAPIMGSGIMLWNQTPEKSLINSSGLYTGVLKMFRAVDGYSSDVDNKSEYAYADFHPEYPNNLKVLSYNYDVEYDSSTKAVYLKLKIDAPSYKINGLPSQKVHIGYAEFDSNSQFAYLNPAKNLKRARIIHGHNQGRWALYYPDEAYKGTLDIFVDLCHETKHLAGKLANQTVGYTKSICRPIPTNNDICGGSVTSSSECIPEPPASSVSLSSVASVDMTYLTKKDDRQFIFKQQRSPDSTADIVFVSQNIYATRENNSTLCKDVFYATGLTVNGYVNDTCKIKHAPSPEPVNGKLACKVSINFDNSLTYLEKICNVTASFVGDERSQQVVQLLN